MNVLAKIVIPKTNVTMGYINSELEEFAREEFFRLKKILEIKRKMYASKKAKLEPPPPVEVKKKSKPSRSIPKKIEEIPKQISAVPLVKEESKVKFNLGCAICGLPLDVGPTDSPEISARNKKIEEFKTQISEILDFTKDIDVQELVRTNVDEFIRTAEELKERLEQSVPEPSLKSILSDVNIQNLCESCKKRLQETKANKEKEMTLQQQSSKSTIKSASSTKSTNTVKSTQLEPEPVTYQEKESDLELGTFETEFKEVTKIIRVKKEDGSVSEEKKVIKVKREIRTPVSAKSTPKPGASNNTSGRVSYQPSDFSSKSNAYSGSRTVGVVTVRSSENKSASWYNNQMERQAHSEIFSPISPMSDPVERFCMSSVTLLSTDLDFEFGGSRVNNNYFGMTTSSSLKSHHARAEKVLSAHKPIFFKQLADAFNNNVNRHSSGNSLISNSEMQLLDFISTSNNVHNGSVSFSYHDIKKKSTAQLGRTVSNKVHLSDSDNSTN